MNCTLQFHFARKNASSLENFYAHLTFSSSVSSKHFLRSETSFGACYPTKYGGQIHNRPHANEIHEGCRGKSFARNRESQGSSSARRTDCLHGRTFSRRIFLSHGR